MNNRLIKVEKEATPEVIALLERNVIGTPGQSMCYQHGTVREKLARIAKPNFVNLKRVSQLIGTSCFCHRMTNAKRSNWNTFYIRYFSFDASYRRSITSPIRNNNKNSIIRAEMKALFNKFSNDSSDPTVFYAYVDSDNIRSADLTKSFDFEKLGSLQTILFSRLYPKWHPSVSRASTADYLQIKDELNDFYLGHVLFTDENIFVDNNYFVIRNGSEIVAGIQANPDQWNVSSLPGLIGKLLPFISFIPILNKLFSPKFDFLGVEGVFVKEGYEKALEKLIESVLAHFDRNTALIATDLKGKLNDFLRKLDLGLLDRLSKKSSIDIIARFQNCNTSQRAGFKDSSVYISTFDVT